VKHVETWRRAGGIAAGVATHLLFALTVWHLYWFLAGKPPNAPLASASPNRGWALAGNLVAALVFALPHSVLLHPTTRGRLKSWISPAFYGLFFCVTTCVTLLLVIATWQTSPVVVVEFTGLAGHVVRGCFYGSWMALFYSLHLGGLGWQTGLTPWLAWVRGVPVPRREFEIRSLYRWLRHPIYLSFLGLIWFNPRLTLDRVVLLTVWTGYILVGSWLKDLRLLRFIGEPYRQYMAQVPGYPLMPAGSLARVPLGNRAPPIEQISFPAAMDRTPAHARSA
jgi:protein-S-isoprenylcysteine O-methyltransferase Ste14